MVSVTHSRAHSAQLLTHALTRATLTLKRTNQHTLRHASSICTNSICTNSMHTNLAQMLYNRNYFAHGLSIGQHTHSLARYPTPTFTLTNTLLCTLAQPTRTIHTLTLHKWFVTTIRRGCHFVNAHSHRYYHTVTHT